VFTMQQSGDTARRGTKSECCDGRRFNDIILSEAKNRGSALVQREQKCRETFLLLSMARSRLWERFRRWRCAS
jgi:hypothetical protein